ncbi:MAG TPA: DoxX-like family protein [Bryobacteraceae bacterium]|nr:DoxX-like family protein [Bryobacteraceae bacterium]
MHNLQLVRGSVALVWLYQGLWCKLLVRESRHQAIIRAVPYLEGGRARAALFTLGATEAFIGAWVFSGWRAPEAALVSNPYAWNVLLGPQSEHFSPAVHPIAFACADAASFLEACEPASFDAFSLSNIEDGAPPDYIWRLRAAVRRAAAPDAIAVFRSFAEPRLRTDSNWAAGDRSFLWGSVNVLPPGEIDRCQRS